MAGIRAFGVKKNLYYDCVTGLICQHTFIEFAKYILLHAQRYDFNLGIIIIDLDNFVMINDSLGHFAGDEMLTEIGHRLKKILPDDAVVARLVDDEFGVLMTGTDLMPTLEKVAQEIRAVIKQPFVLSADTAYISSTLGIACYPEHGNEINELITVANKAFSKK